MRPLGVFLAVISAMVLWLAASCSGDSSSPSSIEEGFLNYTSHESVSFGISGSAVCPICTERELAVIGMQIEVIPKNDPIHSMGLWPFNGLGTFTIPGLSGEPGTRIEILGTLYLEGSADQTTISGVSEGIVPDTNGGVLGVTLRFPSQGTAD